MDNNKLKEVINNINKGEEVSKADVMSAILLNKKKKSSLASTSRKYKEEIERDNEILMNELVKLTAREEETGSTPVQLTLDGKDYSSSLVESKVRVLTGDIDALIAELKSSMPLLVVTKETVVEKTLFKFADQGNTVAQDLVNRYYSTTTQVSAKMTSKKSKEVE